MAIIRTYIVTYSPAERSPSGDTWLISVTQQVGERHFMASASLPDLERQVRSSAVLLGRSVSAHVRQADPKARKPAGFDTWTRRVQVIAYPPATAVSQQGAV